MILLDTNVISELMREKPDARVLAWISRQRSNRLYLTAVTVAEIRRGLALLPDGRRRSALESSFDRFLRKGFREKILPFSRSTAEIYAPIYKARQRSGLGLGELDLIIAAIATEHDGRLATRNISDFEETGVELVNPWEDGI